MSAESIFRGDSYSFNYESVQFTERFFIVNYQ